MVDGEDMDRLKRLAFGSLLAVVVFVIVQKLSKPKEIKKSTKSPSQEPQKTQKGSEDSKAKDGNDLSAPFLNKDVRKDITLIHRKDLSHDSAVLRFSLDHKQRLLGLPVGKHFKIIMENQVGIEHGLWNGREDPEHDKKEITRSYTPTSGDDLPGFVDLLIKFYKPGEKHQFPDGGKVSRQLELLRLGEKISIQGPFGRVEYRGKGVFSIGRKEVEVKFVGLMAGGSGITPFLQILRHAMKDPQDSTKFSLIYANQTEEDILVREELEDFQKNYPSKFNLHFTLDRPTDDWKFSKGFITDEMIQNHLPPPSKDVVMLMCGPPPMVKFACRANMDKLGYDKSVQVEF